MTPKADPTPEPQPFAGGMMTSHPVPPRDEPAPLGFADGGLVVTGEGNSDAAAVHQDSGGWTQLELDKE